MNKTLPKIYIGGDHASFLEREKVQKYLFEHGYEVYSEGSFSSETANYAEYALKVAQKVHDNKDSLGIVMCGSGIGVNIAANKVKNVKSTLVYTEKGAAQARENDYKIIALGTRFNSYDKLLRYIDTFIGLDETMCSDCFCNYKEHESVSTNPTGFDLEGDNEISLEEESSLEDKKEQELLNWAKEK